MNPKRFIETQLSSWCKYLHLFSKWRIVWWGLAVGFFLLAYLLGAIMPLSAEYAANIRKTLTAKNKNLDELGIFANNLPPSLEMFIPAVGVGIGGYAAISTGQVYNAFSLANPGLKNISALSLLKTPFAIMEIVAYSIAMSRSGLLTYDLVKKRQKWRQFIIPTAVELGIVILILLVGSIIEWQTILHRRQL